VSYREETLYFYTGTGDSYRVIAWMASAIRNTGADVRERAIQAARSWEEIGTGQTVLLGLMMPTHGFTALWAMIRFALRLPRCCDTHAADYLSCIQSVRAWLKHAPSDVSIAMVDLIAPMFVFAIDGVALHGPPICEFV
jgi:hypothetical protein